MKNNTDRPEICRSCLCWDCANDKCDVPCAKSEREQYGCERNGPFSETCDDYIVPPKEEAPPAVPEEAPAAETALTETAPTAVTGFDYDGLDAQTVADLQLAEREVLAGRKLAEVGFRRMADGVAIAHDTLCGTGVARCDSGKGIVHQVENSKHGNRGENTFRHWCESVGVGKTTAYKLLQVSELFDKSSPNQQELMKELSPTLLYAAAKPSAPAELVQAVKDGDITTHKQYQALLAEIRQRDARIDALIQASEDADARTELAEQKARAANQKAERAQQAAHDYHLQAQEAQAGRSAALDREGELMARAVKAERQLQEVRKELEGSQQLAKAAIMRGDKFKAEAEAAKHQPVAGVIDADEVERLAILKAKEMNAALLQQLQQLQASTAAAPSAGELWDALACAERAVTAVWEALMPNLLRMNRADFESATNRWLVHLNNIEQEVMACPIPS